MGTNQTTKETRRASYDAVIPKAKERSRLILETLGSRSMTVSEITDELVKAGRLIPGKDFDPVTGEIYEPEDDRRTNDGQTEEQPKNDGKIVVMERAAAQA